MQQYSGTVVMRQQSSDRRQLKVLVVLKVQGRQQTHGTGTNMVMEKCQ